MGWRQTETYFCLAVGSWAVPIQSISHDPSVQWLKAQLAQNGSVQWLKAGYPSFWFPECWCFLKPDAFWQDSGASCLYFVPQTGIGAITALRFVLFLWVCSGDTWKGIWSLWEDSLPRSQKREIRAFCSSFLKEILVCCWRQQYFFCLPLSWWQYQKYKAIKKLLSTCHHVLVSILVKVNDLAKRLWPLSTNTLLLVGCFLNFFLCSLLRLNSKSSSEARPFILLV